ncbi:hypothetical protein D8674_001935 [Pyrus ussuriensis x Pyrus communis]|uniref:Uncharacterized protein n=1 Tax=Pyrus ussuriensis x Pyrus communis TaxID=2448454 RepID=A0A5N5FI62_9ROSA|nr:hypothetical protein D8674_001935 [Pyrus ussuriensis x Pyrus communis]
MLVLEDGAVMPSWFDIHEKKGGLLKPTEAGTNPSNVLVCGFSQSGRFLGIGKCSAIHTQKLWEEQQCLELVVSSNKLEKQCQTSWCKLRAYPGLGHSVTNEELKKPAITDQKLIYVVRS